MHIAAYVRLSLDQAGAGVQVARQRVDCEALAARRWPGVPVVVYEDNDRSAYRGVRPAFQQLVKDITAGLVTAVVGYNIDRMFRQPRELEAFIDLCTERKMTNVVTAEGDLDLTTHDGQLHARILVAVAKKSSDDTARRVRRAARDRAEQGRFHGGPVPYGFRLEGGTLVHDEAAVADIRAMADRILSGVALNRAVLDRPAGSPGPRSREGWRLLLTGMPVRGRNGQGVPAGWAPVLDSFTATRLTALLSTHARERPSRVWPLSKIARCGVCGQGLYGGLSRTVRPDGYGTYACRGRGGCQRVSISADHLHAFVLAALDERVIVVRVESAPVRDLRAEQALEHLAVEYAVGRITRGEWEAARDAVGRAGLARPVELGDPARAEHVGGVEPVELAGEGFEPRLSLAIDRIIVGQRRRRSGGVDLERVSIIWRQ